jgi:phosphoglycolate phosphatase
MRTVIFDLDGTLADTSGDLIAAANACFYDLGLGDLLDPVGDAATAFRGGRAMLRLGFARAGQGGEAEVERAFPRLLAYYGAHIDVHTKVYLGAVEALEELRRAGYALGVCTNKPEGLAETLLARLDLRDYFGALIGADTLPTRKPDAAPYRAAVEGAGGDLARSFLLGDTETDRETARAAGVPCVLVTFGPDGRGVEALAPEGLLDHYDDLAALTRRLIG